MSSTSSPGTKREMRKVREKTPSYSLTHKGMQDTHHLVSAAGGHHPTSINQGKLKPLQLSKSHYLLTKYLTIYIVSEFNVSG
jgi:hypothetical protein